MAQDEEGRVESGYPVSSHNLPLIIDRRRVPPDEPSRRDRQSPSFRIFSGEVLKFAHSVDKIV
jgi:hypothetical protein